MLTESPPASLSIYFQLTKKIGTSASGRTPYDFHDEFTYMAYLYLMLCLLGISRSLLLETILELEL
jgi:hypothetical protein